jgi:hypothetical protein
MNYQKIISAVLLINTLVTVPSVFAQGLLNRPSFFQDGQRMMDQEIQRLQQQQQQQQQQQSSENTIEHPSQLLTITDGSLRWQKFIFRDAGFSVWMPQGMQSQETVNLNTVAGKVNFQVFATHPQDYRFLAAYTTDNNLYKLGNSQAILQAVREGIIAKTQFNLTNRQSISFEQYLGEQFTLANGKEMIAFRVYLVKDKVYVLAVDQKSKMELSEDILSFFNSFRILQ